MKRKPTILITAYAAHPEKGSEDGTAWNMIQALSKEYNIIAITRENNAPAIDNYLEKHPNPNLKFFYFDLPYWMRFWKKKGRGALLYFFLWQLCLPFFVLYQRFRFDVAHALNFHCNWIPSFLWVLGKPFFWGPIGHHDPIPTQYLQEYAATYRIQEFLKKWMKRFCWYASPFTWLCLWRAKKLFIVSDAATRIWPFLKHKMAVLPAVGMDWAKVEENIQNAPLIEDNTFRVLSVGRFVPLKGFDLTIKAFAHFYRQLPENEQEKAKLILVGKGKEQENLEALSRAEGIESAVKWIAWMPRKDVFTIFKSSDIFLFPSHEGAGMVVPEAMAFGLPVICLDNNGPGQLVTDDCSIKIPMGNYEDTVLHLSQGLMNLYKSDELREAMAEAGRLAVKKRFSWELKATIIGEAYGTITNKSQAATNYAVK